MAFIPRASLVQQESEAEFATNCVSRLFIKLVAWRKKFYRE